MRNRGIGALVFACAGFLLPAGAGADDDYERKGYYINGSAVYGLEQLDSTPFSRWLAPTPVPLSNEDSWGLNVRAGYRVSKWLAFEIQYEWLNGIEVKQSRATAFGPVNGVVATYRPDTVTANAKVTWPIWRAQPYLLAGAGLATYDVDFVLPALSRGDSGFAVRAGGGLDFYLTKSLVLNVEGTYVINTDSVTVPTSPVGDITLIEDLYYVSLGAGLTIRF